MKTINILFSLITFLFVSCTMAQNEKRMELPEPKKEKTDTAGPIKTNVPTVTETEIKYDYQFLIEMHKDQSVWYQVMSPVSKMAAQKVNEPITKNLSAAIADYIKGQGETKKEYIIKGHPDTNYKTFEKVVNALKENKITKYKILTTEQ